jgi:hypothetical protein
LKESNAMSDKDEAAKKLAQAHYDLEPGIVQIFQIRDRPELEALPTAPIKLLEVNTDTCESGIIPIDFGPSPATGIPYPSVIVEVTPGELEKIRGRELSLPDGWTIEKEYPKGSL